MWWQPVRAQKLKNKILSAMKLHNSLPCSKQPSTWPYPVPNESNPRPQKVYTNYFNIILQARPSLRWLVACVSPRRPGFNRRSIHLGFAVDKVALEWVIFHVLGVCSVNIIPALLHIGASNTDAIECQQLTATLNCVSAPQEVSWRKFFVQNLNNSIQQSSSLTF